MARELKKRAVVLVAALLDVRVGVCSKGFVLMAERKVVRSCLSECLRYRNVRDSGHVTGPAMPQSAADGRKNVLPLQTTHPGQDNW